MVLTGCPPKGWLAHHPLCGGLLFRAHGICFQWFIPGHMSPSQSLKNAPHFRQSNTRRLNVGQRIIRAKPAPPPFIFIGSIGGSSRRISRGAFRRVSHGFFPRQIIFCLILLLLLPCVLFAQGGAKGAGREKGQGNRLVRLGIYHSRPALCAGMEPAQRDLRVIRLAWGVGNGPRQWTTSPWFYQMAFPKSKMKGQRGKPRPDATDPELTLDTKRLWGTWGATRAVGWPDFPSEDNHDPLLAWRQGVLKGWAGLKGAGVPSMNRFSLRPVHADQYPTWMLPSRLSGSRWLPYMKAPATSKSGGCHSWPNGVTFSGKENSGGYRMKNHRAGLNSSFEMNAFASRSDLWRAFANGRLDALLLEGEDLSQLPANLLRSQKFKWFRQMGGLQVVLRLGKDALQKLKIEARRALFQALPRTQVHQLAGKDRFTNPKHYLGPLLPMTLPPNVALQGNSFEARRGWFNARNGVEKLTLVAPDFPFAQKLALLIQNRLQRSLNLSLSIRLLPFDQFAKAAQSEKAQLVLEVLDLDDGSLQAAWAKVLAMQKSGSAPRAMGGDSASRSAAPEPLPNGAWASEKKLLDVDQRLGRAGVMMPLLQSHHLWLLPDKARAKARKGWLKELCPGCAPISPLVKPSKIKKGRVSREG